MAVSIGDCLDKAVLISVDATLAQAVSMFKKHADLPYLTLVKEKKPAGLLSRAEVFELAAAATPDQLQKVSISRVKRAKPIIVDAETTISAFIEAPHSSEVMRSKLGCMITRNRRFAGVLNASKLIELYTAMEPAAVAVPEVTPDLTEQSPLLGTLAHEIRTPLTGMMGLAEMLVSRVRDPENRSIAKTIVRSGDTLDRILKDMLDYASLEAGRLEPQQEACDVTELIDDLRRLWSPESTRRKLDFSVNFVPAGPHRIEADLGRIRQIANNLVSNALKFTSEGDVSVSIATQTLGSTLMLSLAVSDTGRGLSGDDRERFLQAFEKGRAADDTPGWGLGLTISQALAHHLGGKLNHADNPGGGSVFTLMVPVKRAKATPWKNVEAPKRGKFELGDVLLIEDHEASAMVTIDALEQAGWTVHHAGTINAAELYCTRTQFQMIISDLHLPDGNAMTLIDKVRRHSGVNSETPIIVMTADITDGRRQACLAMGADRALKKPVAGPELVATLADVLMSKAATGGMSAPQLRGRIAS